MIECLVLFQTHLKKEETFSTFVCGGLLPTLPLFPLGFFIMTCRVMEGVLILSDCLLPGWGSSLCSQYVPCP